ncbi:hypothetical protein GX586_08700 [bacterium]|nr:hypothetical protein [bacterium]
MIGASRYLLADPACGIGHFSRRNRGRAGSSADAEEEDDEAEERLEHAPRARRHLVNINRRSGGHGPCEIQEHIGETEARSPRLRQQHTADYDYDYDYDYEDDYEDGRMLAAVRGDDGGEGGIRTLGTV